TVPRGRFPWLAALYYDSNPDALKVDLVYKCVTTLVSARTVMTAAHCIYGVLPNDLRVYVGRHDVTLHPEQHATLMLVQSVHTQPDFVGNLVPDSDVGLLVLTERVQYSIYVRPICMWSSSSSVSIGDSEQTAVAGWGTDATFKPTRYPVTVNVRPVSREECLREMITARDFLTPRTICAGNDQGHGPCLGDSGGGLMVLRNNRWFLRGIVSVAQRAGLGCDLSRYVIYCDVARHLSWIERTIV
ncbi:gd, partial [Drosophila busckii]